MSGTIPKGAVSPILNSDHESDSREESRDHLAAEDNLVLEKGKAQGEATPPQAQGEATPPPPPPPAPDMSAYEPLGVWTIPWDSCSPGWSVAMTIVFPRTVIFWT